MEGKSIHIQREPDHPRCDHDVAAKHCEVADREHLRSPAAAAAIRALPEPFRNQPSLDEERPATSRLSWPAPASLRLPVLALLQPVLAPLQPALAPLQQLVAEAPLEDVLAKAQVSASNRRRTLAALAMASTELAEAE
jgi:hypothetical protein